MRSRTFVRSASSDFEAEALGEFVVDVERFRRLDGLDGHVEIGLCRRAREWRNSPGSRLGRASLARDRADQRILEAGDERVGAEHDLDVLARAALERLAVDRADEIDRHASWLGRLAFGPRVVDAAGVGQALEGVRRPRPRRRRPAARAQYREIADLELRQHFQRHFESEIAARLQRRLDLLGLGRQFDLRLHGEAQAVLVDDLLVGRVDRLLHDIGHHGAAIDALEMGDRHLARAEAVDLDLGLEVGELRVELRGEIAGGHHDVIFALQPLAQRLRHLHRQNRLSLIDQRPTASAARPNSPRFAVALANHSQRAAMVRAEGLEPPRFWSPEPKSGASTSSATPALRAPVSEEAVGTGRALYSLRRPRQRKTRDSASSAINP